MNGVDASRSLGRCKMPIGYQLFQLDSGHFMWRHDESDDESCISWSKWAVYHGAHADFRRRLKEKK